MKLIKILGLSALLMPALLGVAQAAALEIGQRLSPQQIKALATQTMTVGGQKLKVLTASSPKAGSNSTQPTTMVINTLGAVGESRNEVLVSQVSTAVVRSAVSRLGLSTVSAHYYDHTGITALRFASFDQTVWARDQLAQRLPQAVVAVPVQYAVSKPR